MVQVYVLFYIHLAIKNVFELKVEQGTVTHLIV